MLFSDVVATERDRIRARDARIVRPSQWHARRAAPQNLQGLGERYTRNTGLGALRIGLCKKNRRGVTTGPLEFCHLLTGSDVRASRHFDGTPPATLQTLKAADAMRAAEQWWCADYCEYTFCNDETCVSYSNRLNTDNEKKIQVKKV